MLGLMSAFVMSIYNSDLMAAFQWDVTGPFTLEPMNGILEPKSSCAINATFHPKVN